MDDRTPPRPWLRQPSPVTDRDRLPPWLCAYYEPAREKPANFGTRVGSYLLDGFFFVMLLLGGLSLNGLLDGQEPGGIAVFAALVLCYPPISTARWGGTPGKRMRGMRVARARDGQRLSYGRALTRHLVHWVLRFTPIVGLLNYLSPLWDEPLQQCFHDKVVSTVVVIRV